MRHFMMPSQRPQSQQPIVIRPAKRRTKRRFRWYLLFVPLVILFAVWLAQGIQPAFSWDDVMDHLNVRDRQRYTQLAVLGVLITTAVAILRVLRGSRDDDA